MRLLVSIALMRDVPRPIALNRHKVLHGAATRDPVHRVKVLGQAADSRWRDPAFTAWQRPHEAMDDDQIAAAWKGFGGLIVSELSEARSHGTRRFSVRA